MSTIPKAPLIAKGLGAMLLLAAAMNPLQAHHGGSGGGSAAPGLLPRNQVAYSLQVRMGEQGDRDRWLNSLAGELAFGQAFSFYGAASYHYLSQKNRSDAGRLGRVEIGLKAMPLESGPWQWTLQAAYLPATGPTRSRFVDEDYQEGRIGTGLGYNASPFFGDLSVSGAFPLSRLPEQAPPPQDPVQSIAYEPPPARQTHELKKSTAWRLRVGGFLSEQIYASAAFNYRLPYAGVLKERDAQGEAPSIYRSLDFGLGYEVEHRLQLELGYEHPLYQKRSRPSWEVPLLYFGRGVGPENPRAQRLYAGAWRFAFVLHLWDADPENQDLDEDQWLQNEPAQGAEQ
ncbi:MAG: hypothetical protein K1X75_00865 [Leptospirales bacterium]|nr:hypothetical protein [Leptospirales bacterium]